MEDRKTLILNTISDLVTSFLYYDRKDDEELTVGEIENAISCNVITVNEIIEHFTNSLKMDLGY